MNTWHKLRNNFKNEPDIWFFYLFLLTLPFSIRKVITYYPIRDQFNEYTGIYLYLSDIFLVLTLFSWFIILCHKYRVLSIIKSLLIPRHKLWTKLYPQFSPQNILAYLSLILILWSFLSILWSDNQIIALFRSLKLLGFFLLAIYVAFQIVPRGTIYKLSLDKGRCPEDRGIFTETHETISQESTSIKIPPTPLYKGEENGTFLKDTIKLLILGGLINSILAIWQFIQQHSIGLTFLKESVLSPNIDGVAKIVIFGQKLIRAYGFFPHPNVLGGFLLLTIVLTIYYRQMFRAKLNVPRGTFNGAGARLLARQVEHFSNSPFPKGRCPEDRGIFTETHTTISQDPNSIKIPPTPLYKGGGLWPWLFIAIQIIALILTFSKSAIIGLLITLIYINVPRGTFSTNRVSRMFHACLSGRQVEHLAKIALAIFFLISLPISVFPNLSPIQIQSLEEREMLSIVAPARIATQNVAGGRGTIADLKTLVIGVGQGQLVWSMRNNPDLLDWQFQPIHNVFLLIWSELGIFGLILFVWMLWKMFHVEHFNNSPLVKGDVRLGQRDFYENPTNHIEGEIKAKIPPTPLYKGGVLVFQAILLGFIFILLFDHYLWDIQQGQIMFWLMIGLLIGTSLTENNKSDAISL